ncbi:MAG: kelch repeat-containing protein [Gemmatimonadota bacterium]
MSSPSLPRASHPATLLQGGRVLIAGGCTTGGATAHAEIYDVAADCWMRGDGVFLQ